MEYQKCLLCGERDATKTNSHIVSSFLVAQVCSYDGSGKSNREVMFTMTPYEDKVYTGQIPDTKYEELFNMDHLSDERIDRELKDNTASKDYILCPVCEKRLSDILETPYAKYHKQGGNIAPQTAYMFWLSIVWRLSISEQFAFRLPPAIEQGLRRDLHIFMESVSNGVDTSPIIKSCPFRYRLIKAEGSNANRQGYLGGHYNYDHNILTYTIGDLILCAQFNENALPEEYHYYGFEKLINEVPLNNGDNAVSIHYVKGKEYDALLRNFVIQTAKKKMQGEMEKAQACWNAVGLEGKMPSNIMGAFLQTLYSETIKQGDRHSKERYVDLFNEVLQSFGFEQK